MGIRTRPPRRLILFLTALALLGVAAALVDRATTLPPLTNRSVSNAYSDTEGTRLGVAFTPEVQTHPGLSGIRPLADARDAFAGRMLLVNAAERSLDIQYYIWRNDLSGTLLLDALRRAAERGVRVRPLLDDNNTSGMDETLAALDAQPNIEVRLFNPFVIRSPRLIGFVTAFSRLNRRMHNKSFTADNQVTIIGGRNIGDEYFDVTDGVAFVDLDVLAVGPVVDEVSKDFDRYWRSESSYPADRILPTTSAAVKSALASAALAIRDRPVAVAYLKAVRDSPFARDLVSGNLAPGVD